MMFLLMAAGPAAAVGGVGDAVAGEAHVIDGRTLEISGRRFRLFAIDAPDLEQTCRWPNKTVPCGRMARAAMMDLVAGTRVSCTPMAERRGGVRLARCRAGGFDVGANMVHTGWAVADRAAAAVYRDIENKARKAGRGLWKGEFALPRTRHRGR